MCKSIELAPKKAPVINAEVHDDNRLYEAKFDALPWFEQAGDEEIANLGGIQWGGDYEADAVAEFCIGTDNNVKDFFENKGETIGFECHVDEDSAMAWLKDNRPNVYAQLK